LRSHGTGGCPGTLLEHPQEEAHHHA
jgi:hypothetical protein